MPNEKNQLPPLPFLDSTKPDSQKIWRYMDFYQFVDLIVTGNLYFPRADKLGDDLLEGKITDATVEKIRERHPVNKKEGDRVVRKFQNYFRYAPIHEFVTCWHMNTEESMLMWQQYAKKGIVIQSTIEDFIESIKPWDDSFLFTKVRYIDEMDILPWNHVVAPLAYKRKSYEYENEFRAICFDDQLTEMECLNKHTDLPKGRPIKITDFKCLIKQVYTYPGADDLFFNCTKKIMEKCEISDKFVESPILKKSTLT